MQNDGRPTGKLERGRKLAYCILACVITIEYKKGLFLVEDSVLVTGKLEKDTKLGACMLAGKLVKCRKLRLIF